MRITKASLDKEKLDLPHLWGRFWRWLAGTPWRREAGTSKRSESRLVAAIPTKVNSPIIMCGIKIGKLVGSSVRLSDHFIKKCTIVLFNMPAYLVEVSISVESGQILIKDLFITLCDSVFSAGKPICRNAFMYMNTIGNLRLLHYKDDSGEARCFQYKGREGRDVGTQFDAGSGECGKCQALWNRVSRSAKASEAIEEACSMQLVRPVP